jgi:hypothetical protein
MFDAAGNFPTCEGNSMIYQIIRENALVETPKALGAPRDRPADDPWRVVDLKFRRPAKSCSFTRHSWLARLPPIHRR